MARSRSASTTWAPYATLIPRSSMVDIGLPRPAARFTRRAPRIDRRTYSLEDCSEFHLDSASATVAQLPLSWMRALPRYRVGGVKPREALHECTQAMQCSRNRGRRPGGGVCGHRMQQEGGVGLGEDSRQ